MASSSQSFESLCRLCLEDGSTDMHHIFDEGLNNKIIILSGLDVHNADILPKHICRDCRYQLEKSYYFRMVAKQSDTRLRKHIRLVNQNKPSDVLNKGYQDDDTEEFDEIYLESYKYFKDAQMEVERLQLEFQAEKQRIIQEEVEKAKASTRIKQSTSPKKQIPEKPILLNKCAPTNQRFDKTPTLRRKRKQELHSPPAAGEIILENFEIQFMSNANEVDETHVYQVEKVSGKTEIDFIQNAVYTEEIMEQFEQSADSDEEYKPLAIKKKSPRKQAIQQKYQSVATKSDRRRLKKIPINEANDDQYFKTIDDADYDDLDENGEKKIFRCAFEKCPERFARRQACKTHFYNHLALQSVANGFTCKFCKKTFKVASALERHERVHTGDKPFKCDVDGCAKAFTQKEMLKRHKVIHLSIEDAPFACRLCDKKFRQKEPLRLHINKAHSENTPSHPFTCTICKKQFAHSSGLSRHFLIHSGRLFSCEVCEKGFNDKSALKRHGSVHNK